MRRLKIEFTFLFIYILLFVDSHLQRLSNSIFTVKANAGRVTTAELVNRIYSFCEVLTGKVLYPYQEQFSKRVIRSILENDGEEITSLFARQSGKSETISDTVSGLMVILPILANMPMFADDKRLMMFKEGFTVGIFAPGQHQAQITYNRIRSRLTGKTAQKVLHDPEIMLNFTTSNGTTCSLSNGSFVTAISASDQSNIEGESFMLIICEECQDISNFKITKSIHPMGAAYNATIVKIGTATTFKGNFYFAIQRNKKNDASKSSHIRNHFEYDWKIAAKYNPKYARYVEKEKLRLGENSDEFRMSYCLEWIIERGMFIDIDIFEQNNGEPLLDRVMYDKKAVHCAGIDIGGANDDTIITECEVDWSTPVISETRTDPETGEDMMYECYNSYLKDWFCIHNVPNHEEQYPMIVDYLSHFNNARVICDATRERSVSDRLQANLKCEVIPFVFTSKSKSELYKTLEREISSGRARVCMSESAKQSKEYQDFIHQLGDLQKGWRGSNLVVAHPDEKDAHDDYPDSWALAVWGCTTKGSTTVPETFGNSFTQKTQNQIKSRRSANRLMARRR